MISDLTFLEKHGLWDQHIQINQHYGFTHWLQDIHCILIDGLLIPDLCLKPEGSDGRLRKSLALMEFALKHFCSSKSLLNTGLSFLPPCLS